MECTVGSLAHAMQLASKGASKGAPPRALHLFALARANELDLLAERTAAPIARAPQSRPHWLRRLLRRLSPV